MIRRRGTHDIHCEPDGANGGLLVFAGKPVGKLRAVVGQYLGDLEGCNLLTLAVRRGAYLRGYVYAFIESFAPTWDRGAVEQALAGNAEAIHYVI